VQNYYDALRINIQLIELEKQNIEVAILNLNRSKELYENGSITNIQFRQAQLNLLQTQNKMNNYKYVCKVFEYQLLRMTNDLVK
jgi:outer membrane protein TolC